MFLMQESFILSLALSTVKFVQVGFKLSRKCLITHSIHIQIKCQHFHCPTCVSRVPTSSQKRHEMESCLYVVR